MDQRNCAFRCGTHAALSKPRSAGGQQALRACEPSGEIACACSKPSYGAFAGKAITLHPHRAGLLAWDRRHSRKQSLQRAGERAPRGQAVRAVKAGLRRVHARDQRVQRRPHRAALAGRRQRL